MSLTEQYKNPKQEEKKPKQQCPSSSVQAISKGWPEGSIIYNNTPHAGVITHMCELDKDHKTLCKCACSHRWLGESGQEG